MNRFIAFGLEGPLQIWQLFPGSLHYSNQVTKGRKEQEKHCSARYKNFLMPLITLRNAKPVNFFHQLLHIFPAWKQKRSRVGGD